jgi:predicted phosphate transport protein (TIGR00153 family)
VRLIPRDEGFFALFDDISRRLKDSAALLSQLFADPTDMAKQVAAIKKLENEADDIVHEVRVRIDKSFVTPFDREDILMLTSNLDDVIDWIDGSARRAQMFRIESTRQPARDIADRLVKATSLIAEAVASVKHPRVVAEKGRAIKALEKEADHIYREAIGELFDGDLDAIEIIKWKDLYDVLENAMDKCQSVAIALESVSLKNS